VVQIHIKNWRPAALNEYVGKHWAIGHKLKKRDREMVWAHMPHVFKPTGKRQVDLHISLAPKQKKVDPDGYWKSVNDALVYCGLLIDDTDQYVKLGEVTYSRGEPSTTILLTDIN